MRNLKMCVATLAIGMAITGVWTLTSKPQTVKAAPVVLKGDYWQNHDGRWSMWHEADKRWYYTDGTHWFWHDGKAWVPYRFDMKFGHEGFVHGEYKIPEEKVKIVVPVHEVYRR